MSDRPANEQTPTPPTGRVQEVPTHVALPAVPRQGVQEQGVPGAQVRPIHPVRPRCMLSFSLLSLDLNPQILDRARHSEGWKEHATWRSWKEHATWRRTPPTISCAPSRSSSWRIPLCSGSMDGAMSASSSRPTSTPASSVCTMNDIPGLAAACLPIFV